MRQGVSVVFRAVVQAAKYSTWPPRPVGLGHHVEGRQPRTVRSPDDSVFQKLVKGLVLAGESLWTETTSFGKNGRPAGGYGVGDAVSVTMSAETRLLHFWEFPKEVLIHSRGLDDLVEGSRIFRGKSSWNGVDYSVVHETEDPLAFEVDTQAVGVEKVGAEKWSSHIGQDELVFEVASGKIEVSGGRTISHNPRPVGGAEGTRALGGELV